MAGLVPAIHVFALASFKNVNARHTAGHDEFVDASIAQKAADLQPFGLNRGSAPTSAYRGCGTIRI
jgi:hypothetical protein